MSSDSPACVCVRGCFGGGGGGGWVGEMGWDGMVWAIYFFVRLLTTMSRGGR